MRIGAMVDSPMRDRQLMDRVTGSAEAVAKKIANRFPGLGQAAWDRWLVSVPSPWRDVLVKLEEPRVSLYANSLGTTHPVSEKRIAKALARCRPPRGGGEAPGRTF
ncbi:DUF3418 domain-containing protein [Brevibacterium casei]|nr:DUF3418 domain-containing protein [Brevibacterium casei]